MARTGADRRRLRAVTLLVVCKSAALVHAGLIMLSALFPDHQRGDGVKAAPIGASSGHGPVRLVCVLLCFIDPRVRKIRNEASSVDSTEIDNRNWYKSQNSQILDSSGSGSTSAQKILVLYRTSGGAI